MTIAHFKYSPTPLHVGKGTTVVFSNTSKVKHTATRNGSFNTGKIAPGKLGLGALHGSRAPTPTTARSTRKCTARSSSADIASGLR